MEGGRPRRRVESYRDLEVWQRAMDLAEACYEVTREFPKSETYGMTSQIRSAAVSVAANIAEGYGRGGRGEFGHFSRIARGSLKELETHLLPVIRVKLAPAETIAPLLADCDVLGAKLHHFIRTLGQPPDAE